MWIKDIRDYILYEDKDILVCHKPAGIAVQNARVGSMDMESLLLRRCLVRYHIWELFTVWISRWREFLCLP